MIRYQPVESAIKEILSGYNLVQGVTDFAQNSWNLHSMFRKNSKIFGGKRSQVECIYLGHVKRPSKVKKQAFLNEWCTQIAFCLLIWILREI